MDGQIILLVTLLAVMGVSKGEVGQCQAGVIKEIFESSKCSPIPTIVPLASPGDEFSNMFPKHVVVNRCAGACRHNQFYTCNPTKTSVLKVDVMVFSRSPKAGRSRSSCLIASVDQHLSCSCGCLKSSSTCQGNPLKRWLPDECRCSCTNQWERVQCLRKGWHWSKEDCQCWCPNPGGYPLCSTSYFYDYLQTCSCDCNPQMSWCAPTIPEILIVIVLSSSIGTVISVSACYRYKIGVFKSKKREHSREPANLTRENIPLVHRQRSRTWTGRFSFKRPPRVSKVGPEEVDIPTNDENNTPHIDLEKMPNSKSTPHNVLEDKRIKDEVQSSSDKTTHGTNSPPTCTGLNRMEKWGGLIRYKEENVRLENIKLEEEQDMNGLIVKVEVPEETLVTTVYPKNSEIQLMPEPKRN